MPHKEVRSLVLSVDDEKLTEQRLQQLSKFMPGKEEVYTQYTCVYTYMLLLLLLLLLLSSSSSANVCFPPYTDVNTDGFPRQGQ